eukprot:6336267-Amphidinium_carterae.1
MRRSTLMCHWLFVVIATCHRTSCKGVSSASRFNVRLSVAGSACWQLLQLLILAASCQLSVQCRMCLPMRDSPQWVNASSAVCRQAARKRKRHGEA